MENPTMENVENNTNNDTMENPTMGNVDNNANNDNNNHRRLRTSGGKGRRKVEMKKIEDKSSLIVSFSKRRTGLFKKTEDIYKICGKKAAVITFSPHGRPYSVGFPSVDSVVEMYLCQRRRGDRKEEEEKKEVGPWWQTSIEGMNKEELKGFKKALIVFRGNLELRLQDLRARDEQTRDFLGMLEHHHN